MRLNPDYFSGSDDEPEPETDKIENVESFSDLPAEAATELFEMAGQLEKLISEIQKLTGKDRENAMMVLLAFKAQQIQTLQHSMVKVQEATLKLRDAILDNE